MSELLLHFRNGLFQLGDFEVMFGLGLVVLHLYVFFVLCQLNGPALVVGVGLV